MFLFSDKVHPLSYCGMDRRYWRNLSIIKALCYIFCVSVTISIIVNIIILYIHPERAVQIMDYLGLPPFYLSSDFTCQNICNSFQHGYIASNPELCKRDPYLLFLIASSHLNRNRRDVIRQTWGSVKDYQNKRIQVLFIVGLPKLTDAELSYKAEEQRHNDLLVVNISDSYSHLTHKTGLAFQWVSKYCASAKYIVKTDDDSFNIPYGYMDYLQAIDHRSDFISGECASGIRPYRDPGHKWYVAESDFGDTYFPLYVRGRAYILTQSAVTKLINSSRFVRFNPMEDVFWTGVSRLKAHIKATCSSGYAITEENINVPFCQVTSPGLMNIHHVTEVQMMAYWSWIKSEKNASNPCQSETNGFHIIANSKHTTVACLCILCTLIMLCMLCKVIHRSKVITT